MPLRPLADAGTPLIWAGAFHLIFGNLLIGIGEGLLIAKLFHVTRRRAVAWFSLANYVSTIVGMLLLAGLEPLARWYLGSAPIYRLASLFVLTILLSYVITILLEWPFVIGAMWKTRPRPLRTLFASTVAQSASYLVLILLYSRVASISLLTQPTLTTDRSLIKHSAATLYFIDLNEHRICQFPLDGSPRRFIGPTLNPNSRPRLILTPSGDYLDLELDNTDQEFKITAIAPVPPDVDVWAYMRTFGGPAVDLRPPADRTWEFQTGYWSEGLIATHSVTGKRFQLALETPLLSWNATHATVLPGDQVIFELEHQILLFDLPSRHLLFLARGTSPVIVLPPTQTSPAIPATVTAPPKPRD